MEIIKKKVNLFIVKWKIIRPFSLIIYTFTFIIISSILKCFWQIIITFMVIQNKKHNLIKFTDIYQKIFGNSLRSLYALYTNKKKACVISFSKGTHLAQVRGEAFAVLGNPELIRKWSKEQGLVRRRANALLRQTIIHDVLHKFAGIIQQLWDSCVTCQVNETKKIINKSFDAPSWALNLRWYKYIYFFRILCACQCYEV